MPVVINEFEVVSNDRRQQAPEEQGKAAPDKPKAPKVDAESVIRTAKERARRVRAH